MGDHNGMTWDLNCLSPCIFEKENQPGSKFCFAAGDLKVECEDDLDFTPRPTGGDGGDGGSSCRCGLEGERRIVGGEDSTSGKYPWIVTLNDGPSWGGEDHSHACGATLIAANWVVTAAHCIADQGLTSKDIPLLKLAEPVDLNIYTPACLADLDAD